MTTDRSNLFFTKRWLFTPFQFRPVGKPLAAMNLPNQYELIIAERNGERRAFSMQEMAYHHIAQGALGGEPILVAF